MLAQIAWHRPLQFSHTNFYGSSPLTRQITAQCALPTCSVCLSEKTTVGIVMRTFLVLLVN